MRRRVAAWAGALVAVLVFAGALGSAQDLGSLHATLRSSRDFRARVQSALAIGRMGNRSSVPHLLRALTDPTPAVRAAAAVALGRIGDSSAVPLLQAARDDRSSAVRAQAAAALLEIERRSRSASARPPTPIGGGLGPIVRIEPPASAIEWRRIQWLVLLGEFAPGRAASRELTSLFRGEVGRQLGSIRGVAVVEAPSPVVEREARRRRLRKFRVDGSLQRVDRNAAASQLQVRCEVSLLLATEPERNLRGVMNGAATSSEPARAPRAQQLARLERIAVEGAVRGALARAPTVLAASDR